MAFHPNYAHNGQFFVDYVEPLGPSSQVARYAVIIQSGGRGSLVGPGHSVDPSSNLLQSLRRPRPVRPRWLISTSA